MSPVRRALAMLAELRIASVRLPCKDRDVRRPPSHAKVPRTDREARIQHFLSPFCGDVWTWRARTHASDHSIAAHHHNQVGRAAGVKVNGPSARLDSVARRVQFIDPSSLTTNARCDSGGARTRFTLR